MTFFVGLAVSVHAAPVAYDGFEQYAAPANVAGLNQGTGWSAGWNKSLKLDAGNQEIGQVRVVDKTLSAAGVEGGGQALEFDATTGAARAVSRQFARQTGEVFVRFLLRAENFGGNELINIYASDALSATGDDINQIGVGLRNTAGNPFIVRVGQSWRVAATAAQPVSSQGELPILGDADPAQTFLVIARFAPVGGVYKSGQLWVYGQDDTIPAAMPAPMAQALDAPQTNTGIQYLSVRTHALEAGERLYLDEMHIGTDWASVIPEPAAATLLLAGGLLPLRRRRRA